MSSATLASKRYRRSLSAPGFGCLLGAPGFVFWHWLGAELQPTYGILSKASAGLTIKVPCLISSSIREQAEESARPDGDGSQPRVLRFVFWGVAPAARPYN